MANIGYCLQESSRTTSATKPEWFLTNSTTFSPRISWSYLAPKRWNSLPNIVQEADTLCQLKSRQKMHLFDLTYT